MSFFAFSVLNVLDEGTDVWAGESDLDGILAAGNLVDPGGVDELGRDDVGSDLFPPMLREMVGGGTGATVCSGRSNGWRGTWERSGS